jgi:hypothetical protein
MSVTNFLAMALLILGIPAFFGLVAFGLSAIVKRGPLIAMAISWLAFLIQLIVCVMIIQFGTSLSGSNGSLIGISLLTGSIIGFFIGLYKIESR